MGTKDIEENKTQKKRLSLGDSRAVRASLCKLARQYHNGQIPDVKIRNLTYILNSILGADKFINVECELTSKFEQLERLVRGEGGTIVNEQDISNPYAADLKKQLGSEQRINAELNNEILNLKRQLAGNRAEPSPAGGQG
jgi:hypothetical protein